MSGVVTTLLSLGVLAAILLIGAGLNIVIRSGDDRKRGWLMLAAGTITLLNIWLYATLPPQL